MDASALIAAIQSELRRHSWDTFVDQSPSSARGGKGVVVVGCPACHKKLYTVSQFVEHLSRDVIPKVVGMASATTDAAGMAGYLFVAGYGLIIRSTGSSGAGEPRESTREPDARTCWERFQRDALEFWYQTSCLAAFKAARALLTTRAHISASALRRVRRLEAAHPAEKLLAIAVSSPPYFANKELDEEELQEFGLDKEAESEE